MTLYSVRNWNTLFENNRTRELKKLDWVPIPNKQDGDGYTELLSEENGPSLFGAWIALVQIASKCSPRGTLIRDTSEPHTAHSLARMSRMPAGLLAGALVVLTRLKWLDSVPYENPARGCENPARGCLEGKGREWKEGMEGNDQPAREIHSEEQAIAAAAPAGIAVDFVKMVYASWFARGGKDGAGVTVDWLRYVVKRWTREGTDWRAGNHRGNEHSTSHKPNPRNVGIATDPTEQGRKIAAHVARQQTS